MMWPYKENYTNAPTYDCAKKANQYVQSSYSDEYENQVYLRWMGPNRGFCNTPSGALFRGGTQTSNPEAAGRSNLNVLSIFELDRAQLTGLLLD